MNPQTFNKWCRNASPGTRCEYHRGLLAVDRAAGGAQLSQLEVDALALSVAQQELHGYVVLSQKRRGEDDYAYFATRTAKRWGAG